MDISKEIITKISKVKMLVMDVDGVMTDGRIIRMGDDWRRMWSVRDGAGIVMLRKAGYKTGIITGSNSIDIDERAAHLKIDYVFKNKSDKGPAYEEIKKLSGFHDEEISYIGDDVFDVPLLRQVGFAVTVSGAVSEVKEHAHYIAKRPEGLGAVRELCDMIRKYGSQAQ